MPTPSELSESERHSLIRPLEIILSINLNAMSSEDAFKYAQKVARKGLNNWIKQKKENVRIKSQLLEDIHDGKQLPDCDER